MLHGTSEGGWLLSKLVADIGESCAANSLRTQLAGIAAQLSSAGKQAIERYARVAYQSRRSIAWPSQISGIERLVHAGESFALCTPTGSGKTTIAEIAILAALFPASGQLPTDSQLAIYLVPSRALAAEVEGKLSRVLRALTEEKIVVTGLYGGTDWGPTDAWLTTEQRAILICTYEKAEALLRFLGPLFLPRVSLVVFDEAHSVQFDAQWASLRAGENRSYRLETLGARLLAGLRQNSRVIALSAVASGAETALAQWVSGRSTARATTTRYRSTRQLIGRLECLPGGRFEIRYDILDGAALGTGEDTPYVPTPFPSHPPAKPEWQTAGPETRIRPYLFWAAMQLAAPTQSEGRRPGVLISITQRLDYYATALLDLLENTWRAIKLPQFFAVPTDAGQRKSWERCLATCADYFGVNSHEYRLLTRGIALHHGKMPGLMARLLVDLIEQRVVSIVLATSTLTEGVNLPFETVLIPSLSRYPEDMTARELGNLVGRVGRPGIGIEGRALVVLLTPPQGDKQAKGFREARARYEGLIGDLRTAAAAEEESPNARSPLAALLGSIETLWQRLTPGQSRAQFLTWLEQVTPASQPQSQNPAVNELFEEVDALDLLMLSAVVELEELRDSEAAGAELEEHLKKIWSRTYARVAIANSAAMAETFIRRGLTLPRSVYPVRRDRLRLYRTSLPPRSGLELLAHHPQIVSRLRAGFGYEQWSAERRLEYAQSVIEAVAQVSKFKIPATVGRKGKEEPWANIVAWWFTVTSRHRVPDDKEVAVWYEFVNKSLLYRFNWGLGSVVAITMADTHSKVAATSIADWPLTGLPWVVFWLKELVTWGTLDPVVAHLLARGLAATRPAAAILAEQYYLSPAGNGADALDPRQIRDWADSVPHASPSVERRGLRPFDVELLRALPASQDTWRVLPLRRGSILQWVDYAGFPLAQSSAPATWDDGMFDNFDFVLDVKAKVVHGTRYL